MLRSAHYATVTEAISQLRKQGFTRDFNLEENCIVCHPDRFSHDEFEIVDVYYYEGATDPADEATVYAIESRSGVKGILVTGSGMDMDNITSEILEKLKIRR
jgi:hypothetical protein